MNCLIENEYIKVTKREKTRKKQRKKKTGKENGKNQLAYFITRGGGIIFSRELAYFIAGGLLTPCEHWFV